MRASAFLAHSNVWVTRSDNCETSTPQTWRREPGAARHRSNPGPRPQTRADVLCIRDQDKRGHCSNSKTTSRWQRLTQYRLLLGHHGVGGWRALPHSVPGVERHSPREVKTAVDGHPVHAA